jgi:hypothetical protein
MASAMLHARTLSAVVLSFAALAAAGCGGSGGGGDDESQVKDALTNYTKAVADRDGDKACGLLTKDARTQIETLAKTMGTKNCADTLESVTKGASSSDLDKLGDIEITTVTVDGDKATAKAKIAGEPETTANLIKEDGDWKVAPDGSGSGGGTATAQSPTVATVTAPPTDSSSSTP